MKVNLALHPHARGWILEKMALRLQEGLRELGIDAALTEAHDPRADINHFMIFHYVESARRGHNSMLITHVDDELKHRMIRDALADTIEVGVCMSRMTTEQLAREGVPRDQLCWILPGNDKRTSPRKLVIGITSNLYADGRKREGLLARLASELDLRDFQFEIFGSGWVKTAEQLRAGGATVKVIERTADYAADYDALCARIPSFDYYFYMGMDEGSMGVMDALDAGVPTIVTPQGFHLDIPHGITHPFVEYEELRAIFRELTAERRARVEGARALTWRTHAQRHVELWRAMLEGRRPAFVLAQAADPPVASGASAQAARRTTAQRLADHVKLTNAYRWNMLKRYYLPRVRRRVSRLRQALPGRKGQR